MNLFLKYSPWMFMFYTWTAICISLSFTVCKFIINFEVNNIAAMQIFLAEMMLFVVIAMYKKNILIFYGLVNISMISSISFLSILSNKDANETFEISMYCLNIYLVLIPTSILLNNVLKNKYTLIADSILIVFAFAYLSFV